MVGAAEVEVDTETGEVKPVSYTHLDVYKRQDLRRVEHLKEVKLEESAYQFDAKMSLKQAIPLGLQHVCACLLYTSSCKACAYLSSRDGQGKEHTAWN